MMETRKLEGFAERRTALDVLGDKVDAMTSTEALAAANLANWNVRTVPAHGLLGTVDGVPQLVEVADKRVVVRDNPHASRVDSIGVVGTRYTIAQNEDAFDFLDHVVDSIDGSIYEYAGAYAGGRKVFIGMLLPDTIKVGGFDDIQMRVLCVNTHDGTSPFTVSLHVNRLACTNAIRMTQRNAKAAQQQWTMRHTASLTGKVAQARETLQLTFAAVDEFQREAQQLIEHEITKRQFERLIENVFPIDRDATDRAQRSTQQTRSEVRAIYTDSPTQESIRGTAWGAVNAFVEWADWSRDVRSATQDAGTARALAQLDSRHVENFKADVMGRVLALR